MLGTQVSLIADFFWNAGVFKDLSEPLLWSASLSAAVPLILASTGGVISERSGVVNIAMEGMMLLGAFFSAYTVDLIVFLIHWPAWAGTTIGLLAAAAAGCLAASILAWACVRFHANQVIVGMAINILALGLTSYLFITIYPGGTPANLPSIPPAHFPPIHVPLLFATLSIGSLSNIRFMSLGAILFQENPIFYVALVAVVLAHALLFHTKLGLRVRSVGEHPAAADAAGINVRRVRFLTVILSGGLSGLGGAYLVFNGSPALFSNDITQGRGFIALAAMIVGKWTPFGATGACLLFGFGEALTVILGGTSIGSYSISPYFLAMVPYAITIFAVAGMVGRSRPPAADGLPYDPAESA